ncbi:MAG: polyamine aminopropyltransferase [Thermaerobacter sp.]|nr:polyamine aminopropyltransferase [Thermaerobacter sp.]
MRWFTESASDAHRLQWGIREVIFQGQSPYQTIEVLDTAEWGRCLVLDGIMQTTTRDEYIYHEMLGLVPLNAHPNPEDVLIIGGGDGGLVREVLKIPSVRRVTLVEIDELVVDVARRFLASISSALDDERLVIVYADGAEFLKQAVGQYDAILVDSTDPEGTGPGGVLYTENFHAVARQALKPQGVFAQQTGTPFYNPEVVSSVSRDLAAKFPIARVFWTAIPTYPGGLFTFAAASLGPDLSCPARAVAYATRWYTTAVHRQAFVLPVFLGQLLDPKVRVG